MPPLPPSSPRLPAEIERALRAFETSPYPEAVAAFQALVRAPAEVGELARLCLNLLHEATVDIGRAVPAPHFSLRRTLSMALGDPDGVDDDAIDDQLLMDDFSDAHGVQSPNSLKATLPPPPSKRPLPVSALEESTFPPLLGDPNDLSSFAHLDAPQLPDEALEDSLFNDGLLSSNHGADASSPPASAPAPVAFDLLDDEDDWGLGLASRPNPTIPQDHLLKPHPAKAPAKPPEAPKPSAHTANTPPGVPRPRQFSDLKPSAPLPPQRPSAPGLAPVPIPLPLPPQDPRAATPAPPRRISAPALPPVIAPAPLPLPPAAHTPPQPQPAASFQQATQQPATRPRYQNPLPPSPPTPAPSGGAGALITRCRDHLSRSQVIDAYRSLLDLLATPGAAQDPATATLQQSVEQALRAQALRHLEPLSRIPSLRATPQALMSRSDLDHRAGYLLSQVDGLTPLEFLLDLNAMPRQDAALLLLKLSVAGVIAIDD